MLQSRFNDVVIFVTNSLAQNNEQQVQCNCLFFSHIAMEFFVQFSSPFSSSLPVDKFCNLCISLHFFQLLFSTEDAPEAPEVQNQKAKAPQTKGKEAEKTKKEPHGTKNLMLWTKTSVLPTTWAFDTDIRQDSLSVAGYIICPPPSDTCSGIMVTKNSVDARDLSLGKLHPEEAANMEADYAMEAS
jgi:hypothetical protein